MKRWNFDAVELLRGASPLAVREVESPDEPEQDDVRWIATYNEQKAGDDADYRVDYLDRAEELQGADGALAQSTVTLKTEVET